VDPARAALAGLTAAQLGGAVRSALTPTPLGQFAIGDDEPITLAVNDFKRPKQARYTPKRDARQVSTRSRVSMTFTEYMAGVTSRSVRLVGPGNKTVRALISQSENGKVVKLAPTSRLKPGKRYAVKLTTDVTDPGGNPLPTSRRTWRFTTAR
jgi:hypothetical protein